MVTDSDNQRTQNDKEGKSKEKSATEDEKQIGNANTATKKQQETRKTEEIGQRELCDYFSSVNISPLFILFFSGHLCHRRDVIKIIRCYRR